MKKYILLLLLATSIYGDNANITELYSEAKELILESNGQTEKIEEAKLLLKKIENINPNSNESKILRGKLMMQKAYISNDDYNSEDLKAIVQLMQEVISDYPNNVDALLLLSSAYRNNGTQEGLRSSKEILNKAYSVDKNNIQVLLSLLDTYKDEKKDKKALEMGEIIIAKSTKPWQESAVLSILIDIYKRNKQNDKRNSAYLRVIQLEPDSPWALINYASFLLGKHPYQSYDKAIDYAKKSLEKSQFGIAYYVLSRAYYGKGYKMFWGNKGHLDKDGAGKWFKLGTQTGSPYYKNYYGLGSYYYYLATKTGDPHFLEKSLEAFEKCVDLKPSYAMARKQVIKIKQYLSNIK